MIKSSFVLVLAGHGAVLWILGACSTVDTSSATDTASGDTDTALRADTDTDADADANSDTDSDSDSDSDSDTDSDADSDSDSNSDTDSNTDADSATQAVSDSDSDVDSDADPDSDSEADSARETDPDPAGDTGTDTELHTDLPTSDLADPLATPETVTLWTYLKSMEGQHSLAGIWEQSGLDDVENHSGRVAAILGQDMGGWHPRQSDNWNVAMEEQRNHLISHHKNGGIVQVNWHWDNPFDESSDAWSEITGSQWDNLVTPGTEEHDIILADIDLHVSNYLTYLVDSDDRPIPVLFRPLHEIDGGWFWWTCEHDPSKTAELFRMIFHRLTGFHGLHNLIWVWNNSEVVESSAESAEYYPGDEYVDVVAWDGYHVDYEDTGLREEWDGSTRSYRFYYDLLGEIAPGKPRAFGEGDALPNPDKSQNGDANFAPWLYALAWWAPNDGDASDACFTSPCNPVDWVNTTYNHDFYITLDELPLF